MGGPLLTQNAAAVSPWLTKIGFLFSMTGLQDRYIIDNRVGLRFELQVGNSNVNETVTNDKKTIWILDHLSS